MKLFKTFSTKCKTCVYMLLVGKQMYSLNELSLLSLISRKHGRQCKMGFMMWMPNNTPQLFSIGIILLLFGSLLVGPPWD